MVVRHEVPIAVDTVERRRAVDRFLCDKPVLQVHRLSPLDPAGPAGGVMGTDELALQRREFLTLEPAHTAKVRPACPHHLGEQIDVARTVVPKCRQVEVLEDVERFEHVDAVAERLRHRLHTVILAAKRFLVFDRVCGEIFKCDQIFIRGEVLRDLARGFSPIEVVCASTRVRPGRNG